MAACLVYAVDKQYAFTLVIVALADCCKQIVHDGPASYLL